MTNREVASIFATIADMLQIKGDIIHRVLSYRRAAETIEDLPRDLYAIYDEGSLTDIPNIGNTLADHIEELFETGKLAFYEELKEDIPMGVVEMMSVPGVGPKKAARFWEELEITSVEELKEAAEVGRLRQLSGMGKKSEANILDGIEMLERRTERLSIGDVYPVAHEILSYLLNLESVEKGEVAGSVRRYKPTIGDVDILVASSDDPEPIMEAFRSMDMVANVLLSGSTKTSVDLHSGLQVDLRVLEPERFGTLLSYFTGSKDHNVRLRELALQRDLSLNEHAFTPVDGGEEILCATEEEVYEVLGLPYIVPELRQNRGEIEAAQQGQLPDLITQEDIRGDMQMHTTWSDGKKSVLDMARAAMDLGYEYILITDHSYGLGVTQGVSPEDVPQQREEIDAANAELEGQFRVLQGIELEIKADGTLDYDDETLALFDIVLASLHTSLRQPREQITRRLLNAIENPYVRIIGHPRGRLNPRREPADLDMDVIYEAALEHDVALEINASPYRLDLDGSHARRAVDLGVKLTISTDAHHPGELKHMHYGVATARRGWVTAEDVVNTWPLDNVLQWVESYKP